jgi:DNA-binding transcriptional ArsR family regulator
MEDEARKHDSRCLCETLDSAQIERFRDQLIDEDVAERLAQTFKALSDGTRMRIIAALSRRALCVQDLASVLNMSHSAISHQLRTLRDMRLVRFTKRGRRVYYTLDDDHVYDLFHQSLEHIQHG